MFGLGGTTGDGDGASGLLDRGRDDGAPRLLCMRWRDALFAHWAVDPAVVAERLPDGLSVATYDGDAYLGVVPFVMDDIRPRGSPVGLSFPELNLRTYVRPDVPDVDGAGPRGVYFFSLDAAESLGVAVARRFFELPYYRASMDVRRDGDAVTMTSRRRDGDAPPARFDATYRPTGDAFRADPGSLPAFLTENYAFYAVAGGTVYRGDIAHDPWPLQPGAVDVRSNTLFEAGGFDRPPGDPLVHYAAGIDVTAGRIRPVTDRY
jgi:uncharacterized protein YqjF (DUF2071 family)